MYLSFQESTLEKFTLRNLKKKIIYTGNSHQWALNPKP